MSLILSLSVQQIANGIASLCEPQEGETIDSALELFSRTATDEKHDWSALQFQITDTPASHLRLATVEGKLQDLSARLSVHEETVFSVILTALTAEGEEREEAALRQAFAHSFSGGTQNWRDLEMLTGPAQDCRCQILPAFYRGSLAVLTGPNCDARSDLAMTLATGTMTGLDPIQLGQQQGHATYFGTDEEIDSIAERMRQIYHSGNSPADAARFKDRIARFGRIGYLTDEMEITPAAIFEIAQDLSEESDLLVIDALPEPDLDLLEALSIVAREQSCAILAVCDPAKKKVGEFVSAHFEMQKLSSSSYRLAYEDPTPRQVILSQMPGDILRPDSLSLPS